VATGVNLTDVNIPAGSQTGTTIDQEYFILNPENANIEVFWLQCAFCRESLILNRFD
jgi:hypothetical protein